jgi:mono/diheme cytochrome c family protein
MRLKLFSGVAAAAALVLASFAAGAQTPAQKPASGESKPQPAAPASKTVENGKKLFTDVGCWQCHGYSGQGGSAGPRIAPPLPLDFFSKIVREGRDEMPPYTAKVLPDSDLADIHAFLTSLPKPPDPKTIPLLSPKDEAKPPAGGTPSTSPAPSKEKPPAAYR